MTKNNEPLVSTDITSMFRKSIKVAIFYFTVVVIFLTNRNKYLYAVYSGVNDSAVDDISIHMRHNELTALFEKESININLKLGFNI